MGFPREQRYLFVPSLDPPSPVQPPTLSQLISSTWGESSKFGGGGGGTGEGFWGAVTISEYNRVLAYRYITGYMI